MTAKNREAWLTRCAKLLEPHFRKLAGIDSMPPYRVSCGFPHKRAAGRNRTIGQHRPPSRSADKLSEIFISPVLDDPMTVAATLCHELVHAAPESGTGHGKEFGRIARAMGLAGKLTATVPGELFKQLAEPMLKKLGPYPHGALDANTAAVASQSTRLLKASCEECGYVVRVTRKWALEVGTPLCPCNQEPMELQVKI